MVSPTEANASAEPGLVDSAADGTISPTPRIGVALAPGSRMHPTMNTSLLTLSLKHKRDLVRVRQVARQTADLLGFAEQDRITIAAAAFDLACQAAQPTGRAEVNFEVVEDCLSVVCTTTAAPRRKAGGEPP